MARITKTKPTDRSKPSAVARPLRLSLPIGMRRSLRRFLMARASKRAA
jgi:hypothetical protein